MSVILDEICGLMLFTKLVISAGNSDFLLVFGLVNDNRLGNHILRSVNAKIINWMHDKTCFFLIVI